jgi:hypothetical protein
MQSICTFRPFYVLGPISTLTIALAFTPCGACCKNSNGVTKPSSVKATARALPAATREATSSGGAADCPIMSTSLFVLRVPKWGLPGPLGCPGYGASSPIQPASTSALLISSAKFTNSGSSRLTLGRNDMPENSINFSAIRSICGCRSFLAFLNSSALRTRSSVSSCSASLCLLARWWNSTAPITPAAIASSSNASMLAVAQCNLRATAMKINAAAMTRSDPMANRVNSLIRALRSSVLFIIGFVVFRPPLYSSPTKGRRDLILWLVVALGVLWCIALLIVLRAS